MKVVILHSAIAENAGADEQDVLTQVHEVLRALSDLGHEVTVAPFSMDTLDTVGLLHAWKPHFVFNLVETVDGSGRLIHMAPALLDHLRIPYTGASTEAVFLTSNKLVAKKLLLASGIDTPRWFTCRSLMQNGANVDGGFIVKSVWEHASVGLDEDSVLFTSNPLHLAQAMATRREGLGGDCFAEAFIEGREFNISLLSGESGPEVLPAAEIRFDAFPQDKAKVVGYRAKWVTESFEYNHTERCFDFADEDKDLLKRLAQIALQCWHLFDLHGYARVDFRVDNTGRPWVLEVNTNPCLSHDAGFFAAGSRAGLDFIHVIDRIVSHALHLQGN